MAATASITFAALEVTLTLSPASKTIFCPAITIKEPPEGTGAFLTKYLHAEALTLESKTSTDA